MFSFSMEEGIGVNNISDSLLEKSEYAVTVV